MSHHFHTKSDELGIYVVPADESQEPHYERISPNLDKFKAIVGGWIEIVRTEFLPELPCGCHIVMVVNEDGYNHNLPPNPRVQMYYPWNPVVGDVFLVAEGFTEEDEIDFVSLPTGFHFWKGPGNPLRFKGNNLVFDDA